MTHYESSVFDLLHFFVWFSGWLLDWESRNLHLRGQSLWNSLVKKPPLGW